MSNEKNTESIVRENFKKDPLFVSIKLEEQRSINKNVINLLHNASKGGVGIGKPDFIVTFPVNNKYIIVIECKGSVDDHISPNKDKPEKYAVDGTLHYAKFLSQEYEVLAIAVSGQTEAELKVSYFI